VRNLLSSQLIFPVTSCPIPHTPFPFYLQQQPGQTCAQRKIELFELTHLMIRESGSQAKGAHDPHPPPTTSLYLSCLSVLVHESLRVSMSFPWHVISIISLIIHLISHHQVNSQSAPESGFSVNCSHLMRGQYRCENPVIDPLTQQPAGCTRNNTAPVNCTLNPGLYCHNTSSSTFTGSAECRWTNGYSFETSLLLSIFLGMFGADRFYLGYPGLGLLKFCTLGFLFFGQLADIVLIAMQVVGPADGSNYVIKYFGPKLSILHTTNDTFSVPYDDM
jgi:TM2 domain-containing membrane protein YozV